MIAGGLFLAGGVSSSYSCHACRVQGVETRQQRAAKCIRRLINTGDWVLRRLYPSHGQAYTFLVAPILAANAGRHLLVVIATDWLCTHFFATGSVWVRVLPHPFLAAFGEGEGQLFRTLGRSPFMCLDLIKTIVS
jgi:hypothetical protein